MIKTMRINFSNVNFFTRLTIKKVLKKANGYLSQPDNVEVNVSFVTSEEIRSLNAEQRNTDSVTDVLSFPYLTLSAGEKIGDGYAADVNPVTGNYMLGDIIVCPERATEQAERYGHGLKRETAFLVLHGFLHLLGYDHVDEQQEKQMMTIAETILDSLSVKR